MLAENVSFVRQLVSNSRQPQESCLMFCLSEIITERHSWVIRIPVT